MASRFSDPYQNILVAVLYWNDIWAKELIVQSTQEKDGLLYVFHVLYYAAFIKVVFYTTKSCYLCNKL